MSCSNSSEYLQQLVAEACSHPAKSLKRRQKLNEIVRVVTRSGKLWQENTPYYHDALQVTWMNFCRNPEKYRPNSCSVITWINNSLKWRLKDFRVETTHPIDLIDKLPAPPDIPPMLEETRDWAQTDSDGELRNTIFRKRPQINAQVLILRRLPPETPWETIATDFQLTPAEAKDLPKFYSRKCLPLLRKFGSDQGYLE